MRKLFSSFFAILLASLAFIYPAMIIYHLMDLTDMVTFSGYLAIVILCILFITNVYTIQIHYFPKDGKVKKDKKLKPNSNLIKDITIYPPKKVKVEVGYHKAINPLIYPTFTPNKLKDKSEEGLQTSLYDYFDSIKDRLPKNYLVKSLNASGLQPLYPDDIPKNEALAGLFAYLSNQSPYYIFDIFFLITKWAIGEIAIIEVNNDTDWEIQHDRELERFCNIYTANDIACFLVLMAPNGVVKYIRGSKSKLIEDYKLKEK